MHLVRSKARQRLGNETAGRVIVGEGIKRSQRQDVNRPRRHIRAGIFLLLADKYFCSQFLDLAYKSSFEELRQISADSRVGNQIGRHHQRR